ncbi:hypothetical protein [Rahnella contaminans]|uniref:hypothetical protein n=1 Tax=Rahnella contaminans TaxID=2703882 RepID=UPI003C2C5E0B
MSYPNPYDFQQYVAWHQQHIEPGIDLIETITSTLDTFKKGKDRLSKLAELLNILNTLLLRAKQTTGEDISLYKYDILLSSQLSPDRYDEIFKSIPSIVDKLWRKNKGTTEYITTDNLTSKIKDLARSSVIVSTHSYANDFSRILQDWRNKLKINGFDSDNYQDIEEILVEQEAKMASGYFAYHVDVIYIDGLHVEIQIYSQLNEIWRNLSHKLYEKTRLQQSVEHGHGTSASRLVSLGHLLHLAECEAERLQADLGGNN